MTGLEPLRTTDTTVEEIADIISEHCPPVTPRQPRPALLPGLLAGVADRRRATKEKGPSDKRTAPGEEGSHPNLTEYLRMERRTQRETKQILNRLARHEPGSQCPHTPQDGEAGTLEFLTVENAILSEKINERPKFREFMSRFSAQHRQSRCRISA